MNNYRFRRRRRFGGFRSSRFRRSGGLVRRARGNMKAATQQNDISDVTINLMTKIKTGVAGYQSEDGPKDIGTAVINVFDLLRKSEFFESYHNMYDQFRITSIKVKLTPVMWKSYDQFNVPGTYSAALNNGNSATDPSYPAGTVVPNPLVDNEYVKKYLYPQALTVVTAWDRTGLDKAQLFESDQENHIYRTNIGDNITTYSSAQSKQLVAGSSFNCVRYLYPSSQQEKGLYFSTSELKPQFNNGSDDDTYYNITVADGVNYPLDSKVITNYYSDPNCPFKPTLLVGILSIDDLGYQEDPNDTYNQINPVTFNCEFDIGVSFRGLRKAQIV